MAVLEPIVGRIAKATVLELVLLAVTMTLPVAVPAAGTTVVMEVLDQTETLASVICEPLITTLFVAVERLPAPGSVPKWSPEIVSDSPARAEDVDKEPIVARTVKV